MFGLPSMQAPSLPAPSSSAWAGSARGAAAWRTRLPPRPCVARAAAPRPRPGGDRERPGQPFQGGSPSQLRRTLPAEPQPAPGEQRYYATCHPGLEEVVAAELAGPNVRAARVRPGRAGVSFVGDAATGYRANLHLRAAIRCGRHRHWSLQHAAEISWLCAPGRGVQHRCAGLVCGRCTCRSALGEPFGHTPQTHTSSISLALCCQGAAVPGGC